MRHFVDALDKNEPDPVHSREKMAGAYFSRKMLLGIVEFYAEATLTDFVNLGPRLEKNMHKFNGIICEGINSQLPVVSKEVEEGTTDLQIFPKFGFEEMLTDTESKKEIEGFERSASVFLEAMNRYLLSTDCMKKICKDTGLSGNKCRQWISNMLPVITNRIIHLRNDVILMMIEEEKLQKKNDKKKEGDMHDTFHKVKSFFCK